MPIYPKPIPQGTPRNLKGEGGEVGDYISNTFKVCLQSYTATHIRVIFDVMPVLSVSSAASYESMAPVHTPGSFQVYEKSPSMTFSLSDVKLVSRTPQEAYRNLKNLNILRAWRSPFFGKADAGYEQFFGAPPEVLLLSAYTNGTGQATPSQGNINNVPVVLTQLDYQYPNDCVYVPTADNGDELSKTPFPAILPMTLSLSETFSAHDMETFSLKDFREGRMITNGGNNR